MLNMNSPTLQGMISSTPYGTGNIPMYGNSPEATIIPDGPPRQVGRYTIESFYAPKGFQDGMQYQNSNNPPWNTPNPSPKDMVMDAGMQEENKRLNPYTIYQSNNWNPMQQYQTGYYNQSNSQFGYNNPIFNGYSNPYMGQGRYSGYETIQQQYIQSDPMYYVRLAKAQENDLTYDEQMKMETRLWKQLSRVCSAGMGRSEEEARKRETLYDPVPINTEIFKTPEQRAREYNDNKIVPPMIVTVKRGDKVIFTNKNKRPRCSNYNTFNYQVINVDRLRQQAEQEYINRTLRNNYLYEHAIERQMDNVSLMSFFNDHAWKLTYDSYERERIRQRNDATRLFQKNLYLKKLEMDRARFMQSVDQRYMERYLDRQAENITIKENGTITGKPGFMPDGSPLSPGVDPSLSESFSYNPSTNTLSIEPPQWMKDKLDIENAMKERRKLTTEEKLQIGEEKFIEAAHKLTTRIED